MADGAFVVFGATGTVGGALARMLAARGDRVLLAGRDADRVEALGTKLSQPTATFEATDPKSIAAVFDEAKREFDRVDGVAHCVGTVMLKPAHLLTDEQWDETLAVNLTSAFAVVRAAGRALRSEGGSVVLVSSAAARCGLPNHEAIAAAKAGIEGLTLSAAATYAERGIRFNAVAPGLVRSEITRPLWENEDTAATSEAMHPLGRLGAGDDVASAIAWLLDPANAWVTGQVIGVDGGLGTLRGKARRTAR